MNAFSPIYNLSVTNAMETSGDDNIQSVFPSLSRNVVNELFL